MDFLGFLINLDHRIFSAINSFAGSNAVLDRLVTLIAHNYLLKGLVTGVLFWGLWFASGESQQRRREQLSAMLVIACLSIFVGRFLASTLPFRLRPLHTPDLAFNLPIGAPALEMVNWSSFPSDHAVLYSALAAGFFMINRTVGIIVFIHAVILIMLPRAFLGFHFPGDLLAGAAVGIGMTAVLMKPIAALFSRLRILEFERRWPQVFYPAVFFVTFQFASMFDSVRYFAIVVLASIGGDV